MKKYNFTVMIKIRGLRICTSPVVVTNRIRIPSLKVACHHRCCLIQPLGLTEIVWSDHGQDRHLQATKQAAIQANRRSTVPQYVLLATPAILWSKSKTNFRGQGSTAQHPARKAPPHPSTRYSDHSHMPLPNQMLCGTEKSPLRLKFSTAIIVILTPWLLHNLSA